MTLISNIRTQNQLIFKLAELGYKRAEDHIEEDADWDSPNTWSYYGNSYPCKVNEAIIWFNPRKYLDSWTIYVFIRDDDPDRRIIRWCFVKYGDDEKFIKIEEEVQEVLELENIDDYLKEQIKERSL